MTAVSDASRTYPVACPKCAELKGYPFHVRTLSDKPGSIEIKLRCRDCLHEWLELVSSDRN